MPDLRKQKLNIYSCIRSNRDRFYTKNHIIFGTGCSHTVSLTAVLRHWVTAAYCNFYKLFFSSFKLTVHISLTKFLHISHNSHVFSLQWTILISLTNTCISHTMTMYSLFSGLSSSLFPNTCLSHTMTMYSLFSGLSSSLSKCLHISHNDHFFLKDPLVVNIEELLKDVPQY